MKAHYDRACDHSKLQVGSPVWLFNPRVKRGKTVKLHRSWTGPFRVMERLTDVVYRVQATPRSKPYTVNRYRLWKCSCALPDDWWGGPQSLPDGPSAAEMTAAGPTTPTPPPARGVDDDHGVDSDDDAARDTDAARDDDQRQPSPPPVLTRAGRRVVPPRRYVRTVGGAIEGNGSSLLGGIVAEKTSPPPLSSLPSSSLLSDRFCARAGVAVAREHASALDVTRAAVHLGRDSGAVVE
jgi:hypothetical protein